MEPTHRPAHIGLDPATTTLDHLCEVYRSVPAEPLDATAPPTLAEDPALDEKFTLPNRAERRRMIREYVAAEKLRAGVGSGYGSKSRKGKGRKRG